MRLPVTTEQFLAEYWQQQPLFCPQALPHFQSPVTAEELAGLAMEPDIDSRMVWQDSGVWHQQTGPSQKMRFGERCPGPFWCEVLIATTPGSRHCGTGFPRYLAGASMM